MVDENNFSSSRYANQDRTLQLRELSDIEQIIVHCTAAGTPAWEDPSACIRYDLNPNHISRSGLATATYHFYINQAGEPWQLVSMQIRTANCSGQNYNSVAVCINHDGFKLAEITDELYNSLVDVCCYIFDLLDWGYDYHGVEDRIHFHRDYSPKACPGRLDKEKLISDVAERLKTWGNNA